MRIFDTFEEAEAALGRGLTFAQSVNSLADARGTVIALLGDEYKDKCLIGETVSNVFVAVRRPGGGYTFYLVEDGADFWGHVVKIGC